MRQSLFAYSQMDSSPMSQRTCCCVPLRLNDYITSDGIEKADYERVAFVDKADCNDERFYRKADVKRVRVFGET